MVNKDIITCVREKAYFIKQNMYITFLFQSSQDGLQISPRGICNYCAFNTGKFYHKKNYRGYYKTLFTCITPILHYNTMYKFLCLIDMQLCRGRYCQEAVNSVKIVDSCPTSKTEWDAAARKKNCSRIALQQDCSLIEKFQYHCVINGYRNETMEVCAPSRIIFGKLLFIFFFLCLFENCLLHIFYPKIL